jgi:hypothetical protein
MAIPSIDIVLDWGGALVVTVSIAGLSFVFRHQLSEFFKEASFKIKLSVCGVPVEVEVLKKAQEQLASVGDPELLAISRAGSRPRQGPGGVDLSARDRILQQWGSLQQIVRDAAARQKLSLGPASEPPQLVNRLLSAGLLPPELAEPIIALYKEGKKVADNPGRVNKGFALFYQDLVESLGQWMRSHIITRKTEDVPPPRPRRLTVVGGYFPPPRPGQPAAVLVGVSGPVKGKQFSVDKALFRIGASSSNELSVAADEYVSEHHASLIYNNGSLLLSDQHSRNGTFLNDQRVPATPVTVRLDDLIRVGNSTLRVTTAAG